MSQEVITKLRDDFEYYSGVGKQYLSNSDIGVLLSNPKMYGVSRDDNKSFAEGRYFHQLLLEPEKAVHVPFVDASSRLTNKYKDYLAENYLEVALLKSEKEHIEMLVSTIKGNIIFYDEAISTEGEHMKFKENELVRQSNDTYESEMVKMDEREVLHYMKNKKFGL